jgi:hypothetical protein
LARVLAPVFAVLVQVLEPVQALELEQLELELERLA